MLNYHKLTDRTPTNQVDEHIQIRLPISDRVAKNYRKKIKVFIVIAITTGLNYGYFAFGKELDAEMMYLIVSSCDCVSLTLWLTESTRSLRSPLRQMAPPST